MWITVVRLESRYARAKPRLNNVDVFDSTCNRTYHSQDEGKMRKELSAREKEKSAETRETVKYLSLFAFINVQLPLF